MHPIQTGTDPGGGLRGPGGPKKKLVGKIFKNKIKDLGPLSQLAGLVKSPEPM